MGWSTNSPRSCPTFIPPVFGEFAAFADADLRDVLPRIAVPTLLLYGDRDMRAPLNVAQDLHVKIPGPRLVVLKGAGHVCNVEAADSFNAELRTFLISARLKRPMRSGSIQPRLCDYLLRFGRTGVDR